MTSNFTRRGILKVTIGGVAAGVLGAPAILRAQSAYPDRPINVVVPFDAGGYNDRLSRAFAPFLQEQLGQPLNIINRGGAGTLLGHTYFMQQPDDGYTILCTSATPYIPLNILTQDAPFKLEDFYVINLPSRDYTMMATSKDSGITDAAEVIEKLKADPTSLSIGVQPASGDLVNLMLLMDANGIPRDQLRLVTFDGGGPARNAVAGNVVDVGFVGGEGFLPLVDKITPLLTFDKVQRDNWAGALITDVGGPDAKFVFGSQRGWAVHSSMVSGRPEVFARILEAMEAASKDPKSIEALKTQQLATTWYGPEESNRSLAESAAVIAEHIDLLKGT